MEMDCMKKTDTTLIRIFFFSCLFTLYSFSLSIAQNLLNRPESVVYDSLYNRYLVSNWTNGRIVQIDSNGVHSYFTTGHGSINGVTIADGIVFACCSTKVKGFDLTTSTVVMDLTIPGAININDVTSDNAGNIYLTDFNARKIYKVHIQSQAYSTFVSGLTLQPNGILFDEPNNRLLLCSFGYNIPILAISLVDSSVSIVANTTLAQCDGFAKDDFSNYYISSWHTSSIHKFDSVFSNPPEIFYTNSGDPVDISYNSIDDILAVPLMNANAVVLLPVVPASVDEKDDTLPQDFKLNQNYPNPFNPITMIRYSIPEESLVKLEIFNTLGERVNLLENGLKSSGAYESVWNAESFPSGIYFYRLQAVPIGRQTGDFIQTKKMILLK